MSKFHKRAKTILQSFAQEYENSKSEFEKEKGFSSSSTLRKKLKEYEKKAHSKKQGEDDVLDEE